VVCASGSCVLLVGDLSVNANDLTDDITLRTVVEGPIFVKWRCLSMPIDVLQL
jgi:hypothetical protein